MGEKASLSEQKIADAGLQRTVRTPSKSTGRIAQLRSAAIDAPEKRADIIQTLEEHIAKYSGSRSADAACRAITTIMTVSMLEILQGD